MLLNTFFALWIPKYVFSQYFLNHSFHIILNNDTKNIQPNGLMTVMFLVLNLFVVM